MPLLTLVNCDLAGKQVEKLKQLVSFSKQPDAVVCMFSFHYFFKNSRIYDLFSCIRPGGRVLLAVIDSSKLLELLGDASTYKRGIYEYRITPGSAVLSIKLPFADQLYNEELIDLATLNTSMNRIQF